MAATVKKKTASKKEKRPPAKKKPVPAPAKKVSAKPAGKAKIVVTAKKQGKKISSTKKTAALKNVAKKAVVKKAVVKKAVVKKAVVKKAVVKKAGKLEKPGEAAVPSKDRLLELRKSLILKKENILKEAKEEISRYVSGENKQLVDTANDDGDWAQVDISEDLSLQRLSAHRKLLHNIDEAILKIAEGTYGICEECGEEISEKRLLVLPTATLCIDCQEQKEQIEAFESVE